MLPAPGGFPVGRDTWFSLIPGLLGCSLFEVTSVHWPKAVVPPTARSRHKPVDHPHRCSPGRCGVNQVWRLLTSHDHDLHLFSIPATRPDSSCSGHGTCLRLPARGNALMGRFTWFSLVPGLLVLTSLVVFGEGSCSDNCWILSRLGCRPHRGSPGIGVANQGPNQGPYPLALVFSGLSAVCRPLEAQLT